MDAEFEIRTVTEQSTTLKKFILDILEKENWLPGLDDIDCFLAIDPTSICVGELNGNPIAMAAMFKYNEQYGHFGCYLVDEAHRGGGYGPKMAIDAWQKTRNIENLAGYAVLDMVEKYRSAVNTIPQWMMERHIVDIPKALPFLKDAIQSDNASPAFSIKQVSEVDLKALCDYDTKVFGYKREKFVERLLQVSHHARVAVDQQHEIVGYAAARVLYNPDCGYRMGPLFSESIEIAKCLLAEVFEDILQSGKSSKQAVTIDFPLEANPAASELAEILRGEFIMKCAFVSTNGLPKSDFKKWFGITMVEAG